MEWSDLRYLLALHRHGSHARAARALRVNATTVGRRLSALEKETGSRLVRRVPGGHVLNPVALALLPALERMEADALAAERLVLGADQELAGTVRLTAGDGLMNAVLIPALPRLTARHPSLTVELLGELQVLDLAKREADVAVRLVHPRDPTLVAIRVPPVQMGLYVGEGYLKRRRPPSSLRELASHPFVLHRGLSPKRPQVAWLRRHVPEMKSAVLASSTTAVAQACAVGLGVAMLHVRVAEADGRLVRVLPNAEVPPQDAWVVYHRDSRDNARVRALARWAADAMR